MIHHEVDAVLRELLHKSRCRLVEALTGYPIQQFLPENLPSTRERVPDLMGVLANGRPLHLELMGYNDPRIDERMYDVRGFFRQAHRGLGQLKQIVLYVGKEPLNMPDRIEEEGLFLQYAVIDIRRFAAGPFLESDSIVDNMIGVLCDGGDNREYVRRTLERIARIESQTEREDTLRQFLILSWKRGLVETIDEEKRTMPFTLERGDDPYMDKLWDQAEQRGKREGRQEGRQEGELKGVLLGKIDFMKKSLEMRFGPLPAWANEKLSTATHEMLDSCLSRLYTANSVDEVLQAGR